MDVVLIVKGELHEPLLQECRSIVTSPEVRVFVLAPSKAGSVLRQNSGKEIVMLVLSKLLESTGVQRPWSSKPGRVAVASLTSPAKKKSSGFPSRITFGGVKVLVL